MLSWFVLWFVITLEPGHLAHFPMVDDHYETREACEAAGEIVLMILKQEYPADAALRVYCEAFPPPAKL
jgi:hypothetical protein